MRLETRGTYPAHWPELAQSVKDAAGWRCVRCRHFHDPHGVLPCFPSCRHEGGRGKRRGLTVHHLDGDKGNSRWWNLLALCQACHLSVQARVIPERQWLLEHSDWFRVYVAGFYASYYGGIEISRAEAEAYPEKYLRMGQPWREGAA